MKRQVINNNLSSGMLHFFRDADTVNFADFERGKSDVFLYHEEHLPYKTTIRKMRPPRGIVPYYNMTESAISRKSANFMLNNQV